MGCFCPRWCPRRKGFGSRNGLDWTGLEWSEVRWITDDGGEWAGLGRMARMDGSTLHYLEYGVRITCVGSDDYLPTLLYIFVFLSFFGAG